jgi:hypothetical protein
MQKIHGKLTNDKLIKVCFLLATFVFLFGAACASAQPVTTQTTDAPSYPVEDLFTEFYEANGGRRVFGDPIKPGFETHDDDRFSQYFRNLRLSFDEGEQAVVIFPLGQWEIAGLNVPLPALLPNNSPARHFPETDFTVQDEFLTFYERYNGELILGLPISDQTDLEGMRTQFFENGRLEWHPELPLDQRIQLSPLGLAHFNAVMHFAYLEEIRNAGPVSQAGIRQADVFSSIQAPVLYTGEEQILYITILTPSGDPIEGIPARVAIRYGDEEIALDLARTDAEGRIVAPLGPFDVGANQRILLQTSALASDGSVIGTSSISFKTWW